MDDFLDIYDLLNLSQEVVNNLNRLIIRIEREGELKTSQLNKNSRPDRFSIESYQTY